jgi:hypothetical protein
MDQVTVRWCTPKGASPTVEYGMTFSEAIDALIDAGDLLLSEPDRVPLDKRGDKKYSNARATIHQELSSIEDVEAACYHESAHFVYSTFLGFKLKKDVTLFRIIGPTIKYHPRNDPYPEWYEPTPTAVQTPGLPLPYDNESLEELALVAVAGGESVRCFRPKQKRGNKNDYGRFDQVREMVFIRLHRDYRHTIKSTKSYWKKAAREVRNGFKQGVNNQLIEVKARLVMTEVFGPVLLNTKGTL